jgi:hypothetical protein
METVIRATVKLILSCLSTGNKKINEYCNFEDWYLAANKDQEDYKKMYGVVNFSTIHLANTYLAMKGMCKYQVFLK